MRRLLFLLLLLPGCRDRSAEPAPVANRAAAPAVAAAAADDGRVECAPGGAPTFERSCTIERRDGSDGRLIVLRAPDGGFRRLLVTRDGRGVVAADGAEPARVTVVGADRIEVAIGGDRYRLPASIRR